MYGGERVEGRGREREREKGRGRPDGGEKGLRFLETIYSNFTRWVDVETNPGPPRTYRSDVDLTVLSQYTHTIQPQVRLVDIR